MCVFLIALIVSYSKYKANKHAICSYGGSCQSSQHLLPWGNCCARIMTEYNKRSELLLHLLHGGGTRKAAVIFCEQVLGSERRNAARADVTPLVTPSANQRCPGRHTGRACRSAFTRVVWAATCCTIAEKLEQLVPRMTPFISRTVL